MQRLRLRICRLRRCRTILQLTAILLLVASTGPPGCQQAEETALDAQHTVPVREEPSSSGAATSLPLLLDLGAGKCIPCKMMAPILEELKEEYAGSLEVVFIDVWQDASAGRKYGIQTIPTQIFYDASGRELFRHEGFFGKEEILAKWEALGIKLQPMDSAPAEETEQPMADGD